jgi:hypothetical protein
MTRLVDICRYVRSKNAGPFWITVDLFFVDRDTFDQWKDVPALQTAALAHHLDVDAAQLRRQLVPDLATLKFSYPRKRPQGGAFERDMHGGQQFVQLLDLELSVA